MNTQRMKILIADDDLLVQMVHRMALESMGNCDVIIANDGAEAVRKAQEGVDMIFMDFQMPILDGIEATIQIRANEKLRRVPIIGVTSSQDAHKHEYAKTSGMNQVYLKPMLRQTFSKILADFV